MKLNNGAIASDSCAPKNLASELDAVSTSTPIRQNDTSACEKSSSGKHSGSENFLSANDPLPSVKLPSQTSGTNARQSSQLAASNPWPQPLSAKFVWPTPLPSPYSGSANSQACEKGSCGGSVAGGKGTGVSSASAPVGKGNDIPQNLAQETAPPAGKGSAAVAPSARASYTGCS